MFQGWGSPDRLRSSGSLVVSPTVAQSQLSVVVDDKDLHASVAFTTTKVLFIFNNLSTNY